MQESQPLIELGLDTLSIAIVMLVAVVLGGILIVATRGFTPHE